MEKSKVGLAMAWVAEKLDRCDVKHEIEALILTGIRGKEQKRRSRERRGWVVPRQGYVHPTPGCFAKECGST